MTIVALPILLPFLAIIVLILVQSTLVVRWIGLTMALALMLVTIILFQRVLDDKMLTLFMGSWKAPYGITLVVDYLGVIMLSVSSLVVLTVSIYAMRMIDETISPRMFYILFFGLVMGLNGAFTTGDVFNLYVWFEVMLMSSFVMITMERQKEQLEGGIKYLAMNLIGSLLFLSGLGLLYGKTGTLNMAHLADILQHDDESTLMNTSAMLFFVAFGIKSAVFPLFFWLPSSYHTPNITITALFAGLLTKLGVYTLIRFFTLFFIQNQEFWHNLLLIVAGFTMVIGGMAASTHYETRRILSYHIISQIGYMIMGLGIYTPLGIAGGIFFTVHNMIAKTNTFLVAGLISRIKGSFDLKSIGGLFRSNPFLAILFIIPAFALAGVPPLSGFFAKFILIKAGIEDGHYLITAMAIFTGLLTLYSMIKIWNEAFLKKQPENAENLADQPLTPVYYLAPILLAAASVLMGIFARPVFEVTLEAAEQLLNPDFYINHVLKSN